MVFQQKSNVNVGRYAVGVHRRVDIYSIESAGIEYSIDMKVSTRNVHKLYTISHIKPKCCQFQDQHLEVGLWAKRLAKNNPSLLRFEAISVMALMLDVDTLAFRILNMLQLMLRPLNSVLFRQNPTA